MTDLIMDWYDNNGGDSATDSRLRDLERRIARLESLVENSADRFVDDDLKARGLK